MIRVFDGEAYCGANDVATLLRVGYGRVRAQRGTRFAGIITRRDGHDWYRLEDVMRMRHEALGAGLGPEAAATELADLLMTDDTVRGFLDGTVPVGSMTGIWASGPSAAQVIGAHYSKHWPLRRYGLEYAYAADQADGKRHLRVVVHDHARLSRFIRKHASKTSGGAKGREREAAQATERGSAE